VFVRILSSAFLVSALAVMPAAAQAQQGGGKSTTTTTTSGPVVTSDEIVLEGDANPRPALPTINGDTGLWYVPTAETLPAKKWSASLFRANYATAQGLTDVSQIGVTGAYGIGNRFELFGSWHWVRYDRDLRPLFDPSNPKFGGVTSDFPFVRSGWTTDGGPLIVGGKWSLIQQGRGDVMSFGPRVTVQFPIGSQDAATDDWVTRRGRGPGRIVEPTNVADTGTSKYCCRIPFRPGSAMAAASVESMLRTSFPLQEPFPPT